MENALRILKSVYYMDDPKKITQELENNKVSGVEFIDTLLYLKNKGLVSYKNLEIPLEISLTDKGTEFVVNELDRKNQAEFNRIVAFTGGILALIGIHTFISDLGLANDTINIIFLIVVVIAIYPIIKVILNWYSESLLEWLKKC